MPPICLISCATGLTYRPAFWPGRPFWQPSIHRIWTRDSIDVSLLWITEIVPGQGSVLHSLTSNFSPRQSRPPRSGLGLVQVLSLVLDPVPQVLVHSDHEDHSDQRPFTGPEQRLICLFNIQTSDLRDLQGSVLQTRLSVGPVGFFGQSFPPSEGEGELHCRKRDWTPPSQVLLHFVNHSLHSPQPPSTAIRQIMRYAML